jgi:hypothetical protein
MRVTSAERARLDDAAERAGMTVTAFLLHRGLGTPARRAARRPQVEVVALARLLAECGKIGSNLNQLARAANSGEIPPPDEITAACAAMQDIRSALMWALGHGD